MKTPLLNKLENSKLKKLKLFFLIFFLITLSNYSQTTYVPDNNFENYLETHDADGNSVSLGDSSSMGNGVAYDDYVNTNKIDNVTKLDISNKNISSLKGIEDFTDLRQLYFTNNNVSSVDLSSNSQLGVLFCGENNLTEFNIYSNSLLQILDCHKTGLSELNISNNDDLHSIYAYDNNLSVFDTSNILDLKLLSIGTNNIKTLNLSKNTKLENLYCKDNSLTILNVANGKNSILNYFQTTGNTNLTCIQVDDANSIGANWTKDTTANYSEGCITNVPDDNFEQALIDLGYDDVLDNYVTTTKINLVTNLDIGAKQISDLTGIEDFKNLEVLNVANNQSLGDLDFSNNLNLKSLSVTFSGVSSLNLSKNESLESLYAGSNYTLISVDLSKNIALKNISLNSCENVANLDLTNNIQLEKIDIYNNKVATITTKNMSNLRELTLSSNPISSLDLADNTKLIKLDVGNTNISELDISNNTQLVNLSLNGANVSTLNLSKALQLKTLDFDNTSIEHLDLTKNIQLEELNFNELVTNFDTTDFRSLKKLTKYQEDTKLIRLDLSKSINLETIYIASATSLEKINLNNGNNQNLGVDNNKIIIGNAYKINCIQVDDKSYSETNWVDSQGNSAIFSPFSSVIYSEICYDGTYVPDDNFEQALIDLGYDDVLDDYVATSNINTLTSLKVNNKNIIDLTGIEKFINLAELNCSNNMIITLDLTKNVLLEKIECQFNKISSLDLSKNSKLTHIDSYGNLLTALNVKNGNNSNVTYFRTSFNPNLPCIEVDDETYSTNSFNNQGVWFRIPANAYFSENCQATASIVDAEFSNTIRVYPNPVRNKIQIKITTNEIIKNVKVYNFLGKKVTEQNSNTIDFSQISSGIYFLKIRSETGKIGVKKIIKSNF